MNNSLTLMELGEHLGRRNSKPIRLSSVQKKLGMSEEQFNRLKETGCLKMTDSRLSVRRLAIDFYAFAKITGKYLTVTTSRKELTYGEYTSDKNKQYTMKKYSPDYEFIFKLYTAYAYGQYHEVSNLFDQHYKTIENDFNERRTDELDYEHCDNYLSDKALGKVDWEHNKVYEVKISNVPRNVNQRFEWRFNGENYSVIASLHYDSPRDINRQFSSDNPYDLPDALEALFQQQGYDFSSACKRKTEKQKRDEPSPVSKKTGHDYYREDKAYDELIKRSWR